MSDLTTPRRRRRRTDADRSAAAVLRAATEVLAAQPDASVEEIAAAAGVSRQTVYAHFRSRDVLLGAVVDAITSEAAAAMDAAHLVEGPAPDALLRLLDASWRTLQRYPRLLATAGAPSGGDAHDSRHRAVFTHLTDLLTRGQRAGEFTRDVSAEWLASAVVALGHAAGDAVAAGRMAVEDAVSALAGSALRVCGVPEATIGPTLQRATAPSPPDG